MRYVNFIEMMCPFFSSDHLKRSLPLFSLGYETGIDRLWCRLDEEPEYKYAVIDQVCVKHTEPVGGKANLQGFVGDRSDYQVEIDEMEQRFGIFFLGPVAYSGVLKNGKLLRGRAFMAALSVVIAVGFICTPIRRWFVKSVTDHWRHILTRPIGNEFLPLSGA